MGCREGLRFLPQWGGPLHASCAPAHCSQGAESASLSPALAFPLFPSPSFWAGYPEMFTTSHCLQTPGVRKSCPPCASLMTSHLHTPSHRGHRAAPRAGGCLLCWSNNSKRRVGRRVWPVGQEPALVLTRAPSGWEAREVRQGRPGDPGPGLMWVPAAAGRAQVPLTATVQSCPQNLQQPQGWDRGWARGPRWTSWKSDIKAWTNE